MAKSRCMNLDEQVIVAALRNWLRAEPVWCTELYCVRFASTTQLSYTSPLQSALRALSVMSSLTYEFRRLRRANIQTRGSALTVALVTLTPLQKSGLSN